MLFGVKASSNLFTHLFINVKLGVADIVEYGTFADGHLSLLVSILEACLRIVDVRGIMGRACAKQWGAHVQSNGVRMAMARVNGACAKQLGEH